MRLRRQRQWNQLVADPQTPFMIGRLLGAHEMAVVILRDELASPLMVRHVGESLERVGSHFLEDKLELQTAVLPRGPAAPYDQSSRSERPLA